MRHITETAWIITIVDNDGNSGKSTSLALDSSDNPRISYYNAATGNLMFATWDGSAWDLQAVDNAGFGGIAASLALDWYGNPRIVYYNYGNPVLKYREGKSSGRLKVHRITHQRSRPAHGNLHRCFHQHPDQLELELRVVEFP